VLKPTIVYEDQYDVGAPAGAFTDQPAGAGFPNSMSVFFPGKRRVFGQGILCENGMQMVQSDSSCFDEHSKLFHTGSFQQLDGVNAEDDLYPSRPAPGASIF